MKSENQKPKHIDTPERAAWRVREFCDAHRISHATFYKFRAAGKIHTIKIGGRTLVPAAEANRIAAKGL